MDPMLVFTHNACITRRCTDSGLMTVFARAFGKSFTESDYGRVHAVVIKYLSVFKLKF